MDALFHPFFSTLVAAISSCFNAKDFFRWIDVSSIQRRSTTLSWSEWNYFNPKSPQNLETWKFRNLGLFFLSIWTRTFVISLFTGAASWTCLSKIWKIIYLYPRIFTFSRIFCDIQYFIWHNFEFCAHEDYLKPSAVILLSFEIQTKIIEFHMRERRHIVSMTKIKLRVESNEFNILKGKGRILRKKSIHVYKFVKHINFPNWRINQYFRFNIFPVTSKRRRNEWNIFNFSAYDEANFVPNTSKNAWIWALISPQYTTVLRNVCIIFPHFHHYSIIVIAMQTKNLKKSFNRLRKMKMWKMSYSVSFKGIENGGNPWRRRGRWKTSVEGNIKHFWCFHFWHNEINITTQYSGFRMRGEKKQIIAVCQHSFNFPHLVKEQELVRIFDKTMLCMRKMFVWQLIKIKIIKPLPDARTRYKFDIIRVKKEAGIIIKTQNLIRITRIRIWKIPK